MDQSNITVGGAAQWLTTKKGRPVPLWRVRRIVDTMDIEIPRAGLYRLIPVSLLPAIEEQLEQIWGRETTPA